MEALFILVLVAIVVAIRGACIMLLWNWLAPFIFGLPEISFWMAVGISILFGMLFGNGVHFNRNHKKDKN